MLAVHKYDLASGLKISEDKGIDYNKTMLEALCPGLEGNLVIGNVSHWLANEEVNQVGAIEALSKGLLIGDRRFSLAGAGGSRKNHDFFLLSDEYTAREGNPFYRYFGGTEMCAINYGSILTSKLKEVWRLACDLQIVEDKQHGTDDCHARCTREFMEALETREQAWGFAKNPFQFRMAIKGRWVAKGTLRVSKDLPYGIDLVVPQSCIKGVHSPKKGKYKGKVKPQTIRTSARNPLILGLAHTAKKGKCRTGYTIWQWFSQNAVAKDILPSLRDRSSEIVEAQEDLPALCKLIGKYLDAPSINEETGEITEENWQEKDLISKLIAADKYNFLSRNGLHPILDRKIQEMLRRIWLDCAFSGGIRGTSFMAQPLDELGDLQFCCPQLPEGEYIGWRYPIRSADDIQVWTNVLFSGREVFRETIEVERDTFVFKRIPEASSYETVMDQKGVAFFNPEVLLKYSGGDLDGDLFNFIPVEQLPNIASEVREHKLPTAVKPQKQEVTGSLAEVAVKSCDNEIGLIIFNLAQAWANGRRGSIIEVLSQAAQIEVDKFKSNLEHPVDWKAAVNKEKLTKVNWLADRKEQCVYGSAWNAPARKLQHGTPRPSADPISLMIKVCNEIWKPLNLAIAPLCVFKTLYSSPADPDLRRASEFVSTLTRARMDEHNQAYASTDAGRLEVQEKYRHMLVQKGDTIRSWASNQAEPQEALQRAIAAMWYTCHSRASDSRRTGNEVFRMFGDEICARLLTHQVQAAEVRIVGTQYNFYKLHHWVGDTQVEVEVRAIAQSNTQEVFVAGEKLGVIAFDSPKLPVGTHSIYLRSCKGYILAQT
jgi:hypothetical protein